MKHMRGLTLIELLFSISLSCFLMGLCIHLLCGTKRQYEHTLKQLETHFELQQVVTLLRNSIKKAGFTPCLNLDRLVLQDTRRPENLHKSINVQSGLKISRMSEHFVNGLSILKPNRLLVQNKTAFNVEHPIIIADCEHAEIQIFRHVEKTRAGNLLTLDKPLAFDYDKEFYVGAWIEEQFYIQHQNLYYKTTHAEALSANIHQLTASIQQDGVQVILMTDSKATLQIKTKVRAS